MTKTGRKIVTVVGSGLFPIDMLRYDHAWPRSEEDSHKIDANYWPDVNIPQPREIELCTDADSIGGPRWASFNWRVKHVRFT